MPMLLKQMVYSTTSRFNRGRMIISRQRSSIPKRAYLTAGTGLSIHPSGQWIKLPQNRRISGTHRRASSTRAR